MSPNQLGMLKYIAACNVQWTHLHVYNQITVWSLLKRGWITNTKAGIRLTDEGQEIFDAYRNAKPPKRKRPNSALSDAVKNLLKLVRTQHEHRQENVA